MSDDERFDREQMMEPVSDGSPEGPLSDGAVEEPAAEPLRSDSGARRRARTVRLAVLVSLLALVTVNGYLHQHPVAGLRTVGVDALCPFGGLESLWSVVSGGALLKHIAASTLVLFGFTVVLALVLRRVFCGYLCPLGTLQELFGKLGRRLFGRTRPDVPAAVDRPARYLKYVVLGGIAVLTWQAGELVIRSVDPWVAYMHLSSAEVLTEFSLGLLVLGVSLVGSVIYDRFFCKYLCPMGALLALVSRVAPFAVRRNETTCTSCRACDRVCPVNIEVSTQRAVTSAECISCNECVNACPVANTLVVGARVRASRLVLKPAQVAGIAVLALAATVALTTATGTFALTMPTGPTVRNGVVDLQSIRDSMTLEQVAVGVGVSPMLLEQRFGVGPQDMTAPIEDLQATYGFTVNDVRTFVAELVAAGAVSGEGAATEGG